MNDDHAGFDEFEQQRPSRDLGDQVTASQDHAIRATRKHPRAPAPGARQHLRVVVAEDGEVAAMAPELDAAVGRGPFAREIAGRDDDIARRHLEQREQLRHLVDAAVDVADEDVAAHVQALT